MKITKNILKLTYFLFPKQNNEKTLIGVKIYDNLISNFMTFSFKLGYIFFRKVMISFQNFGLPLIMKILVILIKNSNYASKTSNSINNEIFSNVIKAFYSCLTFNYNLSFYEYETDSGISESNYILVVFFT